MSKIPYRFTAIPNFLIDAGWMDDPLTCKMFLYLWRRTSYEAHIEVIDGREIQLDPFEFIFGRKKIAKLLGISEKKARLRMDKIRASTMVMETASKRASTYTVYKWSTEHFSENEGQQKGQQKGQHLVPAEGRERATKKSGDEQLKDVEKEVSTYSSPLPPQTSPITKPPLFKAKEQVSLMPLDDETLGGEIFTRLRILEEVLANPSVKNFKLMDGSAVPQEDMERWCGKLLADIFHVFEWYEQRVKNTREKNRNKDPRDQKNLGIQYIEQCIQKAWWKEYQIKKFARDEDEKQAKRHRREG